jgi:hypothetical protein
MLTAPVSAQHRRAPTPNVRREIERITGRKYNAPAPYRGQRWEYRVEGRAQIEQWGTDSRRCSEGNVKCYLDEGLDALGADGWEFVAVEPPALYVFKRRK